MLSTPTLTRALAVGGLVVALTGGAALLPGNDTPALSAGAAAGAEVTSTPGSDLATQITQLQTHLAAQPKDARSWAALSLTLTEQARVTADPALYAKAASTAEQSMQVQPTDNDLGLAAEATLASAQHRFTTALHLTQQALAINPYSAPALAIHVDALTELGRSAAALRAARAMDAVQPGLSASTRLAYQAELRGHQTAARTLFRKAERDSSNSETTAFVEYHLGELARQRGHFKQALAHYRAAGVALPGDINAAAGRAAVLAAEGELNKAIRILQGVVARVPLPQHVIALGELLQLTGDRAGARDQYTLVKAMISLAAANGVRTDLELATFEADHGDPAAALTAARQEWNRRHAPAVADALAWALHGVGHDRRALSYAHRAVSLGGDPRAWHHLGTIQAALGQDNRARTSLHHSLALDHGYPPWQLAQLRATLHSLGTAP